MSGRRADALRGAATARSLAAEERARRALTELDRRRAAITFQSVAAEAGVSARFVYGHAQLRVAIEQLRGEQQRAPSRLPRRERASEGSIRARLRGALEENKRLRAENAQLREELALAPAACASWNSIDGRAGDERLARAAARGGVARRRGRVRASDRPAHRIGSCDTRSHVYE